MKKQAGSLKEDFFRSLTEAWPEWSEHDLSLVEFEIRVLDRYVRLVFQSSQVPEPESSLRGESKLIDCVAFFEISGHVRSAGIPGALKAGYFDTFSVLDIQSCDLVDITCERQSDDGLKFTFIHYSSATYEIALLNPQVRFKFLSVNPEYARPGRYADQVIHSDRQELRLQVREY